MRSVLRLHAEFRLLLKQKGREAFCEECVAGFWAVSAGDGAAGLFPQLDLRKYTIDEQVFKSIDADEIMASPGSRCTTTSMYWARADLPIYLALLLRYSGFRLITRAAAKRLQPVHCAAHEAESREKVLMMVREQRLLAEVSQRRSRPHPARGLRHIGNS
jgi:hypothetical protein